jgi:hypothetical protein
VLARSPDNNRVVARVDANDATTIAFLTDGLLEPVGAQGWTEKRGEVLHFLIREP